MPATATACWPRAIVFDLDGTLVDSAPEIRTALNEAFVPLGIPAFDLAAVKGLIGGGAPAAVARAAALAGIALAPDEEERVLAHFYRVYTAVSAEGRGLYPGAAPLLERLRADRVRLAICTNKSEPIARVALEALRIGSMFEAIVGARDDIAKKPDAAPVREAMAGMASHAGETLMVGDTAADIGAARAAGIPSIALAHGYSRVPVTALGADAVAADLLELPAAIATVARARLRRPT